MKVISLQIQTKKFFINHVILFFTSQNIRLLKPEIIYTKLHKCTSNHGGGVTYYVYTRDVLQINTSVLK